MKTCFKKAVLVGCGAVLSIALAGCASSAGESTQNDNASSENSAAQKQQANDQEPQAGKQEQGQGQGQPAASSGPKDFDGSSFADSRAGDLYIVTADDSSSNNNVPQVDAAGQSAIQFDIVMEDLANLDFTLYVDGMYHSTFAGMAEGTLTVTLEGDALSPGVHTVEAVDMGEANDGTPLVYKSAAYEIV